MLKIRIQIRCRLPAKMDEYNQLKWLDEKARLDNIAVEMLSREDSELFIYFEFDKKTSELSMAKRFNNIINHFATQKLEKKRITLMISKTEKEKTYYEIMPLNFDGNSFAEVSIRAEDFEKLKNLFQPNLIVKNKKK